MSGEKGSTYANALLQAIFQNVMASPLTALGSGLQAASTAGDDHHHGADRFFRLDRLRLGSAITFTEKTMKLSKLFTVAALALSLATPAFATGLTYSTTAANARLAAALTAAVSGQSVDGGSSYGTLVIGTSSLSGATGNLCVITLQKPSFSIASKVATLLGTPLSSASCSASGTAALAELHDSAGNVIVSGLTVGTSGANINLATTTISTGLTVTITSGTITTQ